MRRVSLVSILLGIPCLLVLAAPAVAAQPWDFEFSWKSPRVRIGVEVQHMTPELRAFFDAPEDRGILVVGVEKDGPADQAGVRVGDVILSADGKPVTDTRDLRRAVAGAPAGESLALEVQRKGERKTRTLKPTRVAREREEFPDFEEFTRGARRDLVRRIEQLERRIRELEEKLRRELDLRLGPHEAT